MTNDNYYTLIQLFGIYRNGFLDKDSGVGQPRLPNCLEYHENHLNIHFLNYIVDLSYFNGLILAGIYIKKTSTKVE